jgi:hypothetical protein
MVVKLRKEKNTLTPPSSLNPLLLNPRIEIEVGGLGVCELAVAVTRRINLQPNLAKLT